MQLDTLPRMEKDKSQVQREQGVRLADARERAGHASVTEGARAAHENVSTYTQYENGHRSYHLKAEKLAKAFNTSPEWLLFGRSPQKGYDELIAELRHLEPGARDMAIEVARSAIAPFLKRQAG